ncbi:MAG: HDIG domain-containing protein [Candidatus Eisenbacteria bacterium]
MLVAPGTYHHSLMVGTLAESSANAIGANPLLARVIGYYHDIGKVGKPDLFRENVQLGRKAPRDRLAPSMSRLILERHVREGVQLGQAERLPREVIQGIREHHGFGLMKEAFDRACLADPKTPPAQYCYPGPRPTSREAALVLLANQVDEVSRELADPTPSRIKRLVHDVVQENLDHANLDESGLTLSDLAQARAAFVSLLTAAHRARAQSRRDRPESRPDPGLEGSRSLGGPRAV